MERLGDKRTGRLHQRDQSVAIPARRADQRSNASISAIPDSRPRTISVLGCGASRAVPPHAEALVVGVGLGLAFEFVADGHDGGVQVHCDARSGGV